MALSQAAATTSAIVVDGVRYGHILNPRTGWPVRRLAAVSVVGELCVVAGSASTIAMLREGDGPAWLEALGLPHLWWTWTAARAAPCGRTPTERAPGPDRARYLAARLDRRLDLDLLLLAVLAFDDQRQRTVSPSRAAASGPSASRGSRRA